MSMADRDGVIWLDGEMVPWRDAKVHVLTHTLHYGLGVFEGVRAYETAQGPAIFRLQDHTARLRNSAKILDMKLTYDAETINAACLAAVKENGLDSAYLRPMAFYGSEGMGLRADNLQVHLMVAAWTWGAYLGGQYDKGIRIRTSSYTRHHVNSAMCRAKANGHYFNSMLALSEALRGLRRGLAAGCGRLCRRGQWREHLLCQRRQALHAGPSQRAGWHHPQDDHDVL